MDILSKIKDVYVDKLPENDQKLMESIYDALLNKVSQMDEDRESIVSSISVKYLKPYQLQLTDIFSFNKDISKDVVGIGSFILSTKKNRGLIQSDLFPDDMTLKDYIVIDNTDYKIIEIKDKSIQVILPEEFKNKDVISLTYVSIKPIQYNQEENKYLDGTDKYTKIHNVEFINEFKEKEDYVFITKYKFRSVSVNFVNNQNIVINGVKHTLIENSGEFFFETKEELNGYSGVAFSFLGGNELYDDGVIEVVSRSVTKINQHIPGECIAKNVRKINSYIYSITAENLSLSKADIPQWDGVKLVDVLRCFNEMVRKPRTKTNLIKLSNALCGLPFSYEDGYVSEYFYNDTDLLHTISVTGKDGVILTYEVPSLIAADSSFQKVGTYLNKYDPLLRSPIEIIPDTNQYMDTVYKGTKYTIFPIGDELYLSDSITSDFLLEKIQKNDVVLTKNGSFVIDDIQSDKIKLLEVDIELPENMGESSYHVKRIKVVDYKKIACWTSNYDENTLTIDVEIDDFLYKDNKIEFFIYGPNNNFKKIVAIDNVVYSGNVATVTLKESLGNSFTDETKILATISVSSHLVYNKFIVASNKVGLRIKRFIDSALDDVTPGKSQYEFDEVGLFSEDAKPIIDYNHEKQYSEDGDTLSYYRNYANDDTSVMSADIVTSDLSMFWSTGFNGVDDIALVQNYSDLKNINGMTYIFTTSDINYTNDGYLLSSREYRKVGGLSVSVDKFYEMNLESDKPRDIYPKADGRVFSTVVVRQLPNGYSDVWIDGKRRNSTSLIPFYEGMSLGGILADISDINTGLKFSQFKLSRFLIYGAYLSEAQILDIMDEVLEVPDANVKLDYEENFKSITSIGNPSFGKSLPYFGELLFGNAVFGSEEVATGRIFTNYGEETLVGSIYANKYVVISNYWMNNGLLESIKSSGGINIPKPTPHTVGFTYSSSMIFRSAEETVLFGSEGYEEWDLDFGVSLDIVNNALKIYTSQNDFVSIPLFSPNIVLNVKYSIIFVIWNKQIYVYINGVIASIYKYDDGLEMTKAYLKVCAFGDKKHNNPNLYKVMFFDKKISSGQAIALHNELVG